MIKNYLEPFFEESERLEIVEIESCLDKLISEYKVVSKSFFDTHNKFVELKKAELEIGETDQERQNRLSELDDELAKLGGQHTELARDIRIFNYKREIITKTVWSRYVENTSNPDILQNCLDIIKQCEPSDFYELRDKQPDSDIVVEVEPGLTSDVVAFSNYVARVVVPMFLEYFNETDNESLFKIMKSIYDRTLALYPDGFTDKDKKSSLCIFDKAFFALIKKKSEQQALREYETALFSPYKPETLGHIIPSSPRITATVVALGYIGQARQMTIDDLLEPKKVNDLLTIKGVSGGGLQCVFNENLAKKDNVVITFKNFETASGGGTAPSKVFVMVLEKMNKLGYFHHKLRDEAVTVSVKDLMDSGAFSSRNKAKLALENALETLEQVKVNFKNRDTGLDIDSLWFSTVGWNDKSSLLFMPNRDVDWLAVGGHFATYPPYIYRLNTHAYKLAYYIFTQARINKEVDQNGEIEFRAKLTKISHELGLPTVEQVKNYRFKQLILDKIRDAIKELTDIERKYYGESRLVLKIDADLEKTPPKEIIENGNLVVTIRKGELTEIYQRIRQSKVDLIESAKRKKAKQKRLAKENKTET